MHDFNWIMTMHMYLIDEDHMTVYFINREYKNKIFYYLELYIEIWFTLIYFLLLVIGNICFLYYNGENLFKDIPHW